VIAFRDVTVARKFAQQMIYAAEHDVLTDLPNRVLFNDRVNQAISSALRYGKLVAVLFLDLDEFKQINDSLGHSVGDKLLQSVAKRLVGCVRGSDTVSRQGGDEFVVLLSEVERSEEPAVIATRMLEALARPISSTNTSFTSSRALALRSIRTTVWTPRPSSRTRIRPCIKPKRMAGRATSFSGRSLRP
jgi:diguanylate cyclase (GGDEF)-like protein